MMNMGREGNLLFTERMQEAREKQRIISSKPASLTTIMLLLVLCMASWSPCPSAAAAAAAEAGGHSDDVACLREFKESVTDPLGYLRNWDFRGRNINICNFIGVRCVSPDEPKVVALDLTAAGLRGRISPDFFRKCSSLRELNLSNNFFSGRVPPTICVHNRNLVTLDVSNNNFFGPLSPTLQKCLDSRKQQLDSPLKEELKNDLIEMFSDEARAEEHTR